MAISARTANKIAACVLVSIVTAALAAGYSEITGGRQHYGALVGLQVGLVLSAFELFYVQSPAGVPLRRLPLIAFIGIATLVWALVIYCSIYVTTPLILGVDLSGYEFGVKSVKALSFTLMLAFLATFFLRVMSLMGPRVLFSFLIGRYHRPSREDRVFMFLDIADSTTLAEEFGDVKIQSMIGEFFFDIAGPIAEHGGETYRYIGDEVVVSWRTDRALEKSRCLRCVGDIQSLMSARQDHYRKKYGVVPRYRIGMHVGSVVAGEVGDTRRAMVYFGEAMSVAVALQNACKHVGRDVIVSASLLERLDGDAGFSSSHLGSIELFADGTKVDAYALARADGARP